MKKNSFHKLSALLLVIGFFLFSISSVVAYSKGDKQSGENYAAMSIATVLMAPITASAFTTSHVFGIRPAVEALSAFINSGRTPEQTKMDYLAGRLRFDNRNIYVRLEITGKSGKFRLMDESLNRTTGITNLDKARLDDGEIMAVDRILIGYGTDASITDPKQIQAYSSDVGSFPAALRNGEFNLSQDGETKMTRVPISLFGSQADSQLALGRGDSYELATPIILEEKKLIIPEIEMLTAITGTAKHHIEVYFIGVGTRKRANG